jgi:hypothetical protein
MPRAMKPCGFGSCRTLVRGQHYCDEHKPKPWEGSSSPPSTRASRNLRAMVLREQPICMTCGNAPSTEMGHIVGAAQGGSRIRANVIGQCRACNLEQMINDRKAQGGI